MIKLDTIAVGDFFGACLELSMDGPGFVGLLKLIFLTMFPQCEFTNCETTFANRWILMSTQSHIT